MQLLCKYLRLPATDRRLFAKSVLLLGVVRLGLWLLPFQILRRLLAGMAPSRIALQAVDQGSLDRVTWAVTVASRCVPAATCPTQALATQVLLGRRRHPAVLRIGVARSEGGQFQ